MHVTLRPEHFKKSVVQSIEAEESDTRKALQISVCGVINAESK
jgi:hypothetical protein